MHLGFKIVVVTIFILAVAYWFNDLSLAFKQLSPAIESGVFLYESMHLLFQSLLWGWPFVLFAALISKDTGANAITILVFTFVTLVAFGGYMYSVFSKLG